MNFKRTFELNPFLIYKFLQERLWFKPLIYCSLSIAVALLASSADNSFLQDIVPKISKDSLEELLKIISSSMLVIAIFAVTSMISAFNSASNSATPRSFKLVVSDDVSQNALSAFIGSFIYSIVAIVALKNNYYGKVGLFILFIITLLLFVLVILTFLRWVDRVSRLGRMEHTINQVEKATEKALKSEIQTSVNRIEKENIKEEGIVLDADKIGHLQNIDLNRLQKILEKEDAKITFCSAPGDFLEPKKPLAFLSFNKDINQEDCIKKIKKTISIGVNRYFDFDPDFGFIALSEIASRALSPGINDPGTAVEITECYVRLFSVWLNVKKEKKDKVKYDRIYIPKIPVEKIFTNAFRPLSRDGANNIEVMLSVQKRLRSIYKLDSETLKELALKQSKKSFTRAKNNINHKEDLALLKEFTLYRNKQST